MGLRTGNTDVQGVNEIEVNFEATPTSLNPERKKGSVKEGSKGLEF